ncbi:MAG: folate-binding protein [Sphingobacteriia bacterium]|nr:folate-binding protein [Sphingobacteriia bacterium]NCC40335.1 folate-binding protein [Gammaproteobacteria bacterium]
MHPLWRETLMATPAQIDANGNVHFPARAAHSETGPQLFDLSHLGLIAVQGADASDFLQGQLTNDVRELSPTHVQWSSHCSQKGRMLANFLLLRIHDTFHLQLPRERVPDLLQRLRLFVLRSRVTLTDASDELARFGLAGDGASALLSARGLPVPPLVNELALIDGLALIRLPGSERFELIGPPEALRAHWEALSEVATPTDAAGWTLLDIRAGIPTIQTATADTFVPQMANMQLIDGVSFHKGCYTGQEVVARMQYLGKLKRRMYRAQVESATPPQPGDALFATASTSQQGSGTVVSATPIGPGQHELLAVVEIQAVESGEVRLGESGPRLDFQPLPYAFAVED